MRPIARQSALLAVATVAACELPLRDNPNDPARKPVARLTVNVIDGTRATPFLFDAGASDDPLDRGPLEFRWELHDERYDTLDEQDGYDDFADATGSSVSHVFSDPFPPQYVGTNGEGAVIRRVRVKVIAADGAFDVAETDVVVRNRRPIVDAGEDLFVSPRRVSPIVLDALGGGAQPTSVDPDGETLRFRWEQVTGPPVDLVYLDAERRRAAFEPPGDGASLTFRVVGSDGMGADADLVQVHFESQLWIATFSPSRLFRVYPGFRQETQLEDLSSSTVAFAAMGAFAVTESGYVWTVERDSSASVVRRLDPQLRQVDEVTIPGFPVTAFAAATGEDLCLAMRASSSNTSTSGAFVRVDGATMALAMAPTSMPIAVHPLDADECWAASLGGIHRFSQSGTLVPVDVEVGLSSVTRAAADLSGSLWYLLSDWSPGLGTGAARAIRRVAAGGEPQTVYDDFDGETYLNDLAPRGDGSMWLHDGYRRLNVLTPDGMLTTSDAPPVRLSTSLTVGRQLVSNPEEEGLWLADSQSGELVHLIDTGDGVFEVGRLRASDLGGTRFGALALAPDDSVVTALAGTVPTLVRVPRHGRATGEVDADINTLAPLYLFAEGERGTLWLSDIVPLGSRLLRLSDHGRALVETPVRTWSIRAAPGGIATVRTEGFSDPRLVLVSGTGAVLSETALGAGTGAGLDLDPDEPGDICVALDDHPLTAQVWRYNVASDQAEMLLETPVYAPDDRATVCAVDRGDGATWTVVREYDSTRMEVRRYPTGQSTPTAVLNSANAYIFGYEDEIAVDPDGGLWVCHSESGTSLRLDAAGAVTHEIPALLFYEPTTIVSCPEIAAGCREFWTPRGDAIAAYRWKPGDSTATLLGEWSVPGFVVGYAAAP